MRAFRQRLKYALSGWSHFFRHETNGRIQAVIALLVTAAGWYFGISATEWIAVLLCIALVLGLEMVNTALEQLADRLHPEKHESIRIAKDVAAGSVLWAAAISLIIGIIVFGPRIWQLLR